MMLKRITLKANLTRINRKSEYRNPKSETGPDPDKRKVI
jgi:hypothetical protein